MLKNILIKTSERIFYGFGFGLGMGTAFKIYPVNKKFYKDASSGVRTHEWFNTKVLKTSPLDLSGILAKREYFMVNYYAGNNCIDTIARKSSSFFLTNVFLFLLFVSFFKIFSPPIYYCPIAGLNCWPPLYLDFAFAWRYYSPLHTLRIRTALYLLS